MSARTRTELASLVGILLLALAAPAVGQPTYTHTDGRTFTCFGRQAGTGEEIPVIGFRGASGRAARATTDPIGYPYIHFNDSVIDQVLASWPDDVVLFFYYRECARHQTESLGSIVANCDGLRRMRADGEISAGDEAVLRRYHESLGRGFQWQLAVQCANG
jgi:hypothetical protein